jgi:predicted Ser/Thr protein kinase
MSGYNAPPSSHPLAPPGTLTVVDVENAVGSRLAMAELGLEPPLVIARRYRIVRLLGRGARGVVCQASDQNLHREVAIKLYPALEPGPAAQEAALEAQALARLRHPNVVGVYDFGDTALTIGDYPPLHVPCFFLSMEHIAGQSLRRWLSVGAPDRDQVLAAFHQAGAGLAHAHECGVVHRDVKPDNVVIADDARVLVVDFGLARHRSGTQAPVSTTAIALWQPPIIVGTPEYMAPEARLGQADAGSDQYGFALSLYEALLGALPVMERGLPRLQLDHLPPRLAAVLARALQADARLRYPSMRALLDELPRSWADASELERSAGSLVRSDASEAGLRDRSRSRGGMLLGVAALVVAWLGLAAWWTGRASEGSLDEIVAQARRSAPIHAGAGSSDCPELALVGDWYFETQIWWDYMLRSFSSRPYSLALRQGHGCELLATLYKPDANYGGEARLELRSRGADGIELRGAWMIEHDGPQPYTFTFVFRGSELVGDYTHFNRKGRPAVKGPLSGARRDRRARQIDELEDLPCRAQCRLLCAGELATQQCEATTCNAGPMPLPDCGPPSIDFRAPANSEALLTELDRFAWSRMHVGEIADPGKDPCRRVAPVLAGHWRFYERRNAGAVVEWRVELEPRADCTLHGTATSDDERRSVLVELDRHGLWLLRDPSDPEHLRWAMYGWEFAVGLATGPRAARIRAQRDTP